MANNSNSNSGFYLYDQCYFLSHFHADFTRDYTNSYIAIIVINCLACLPTIFGNVLIILGIWSMPTLHTPSNILLVGLACSDLGVGLIVPPLNIARIVPKLQGSPFNSWCTVQVAYTFFGVMFCGVSFLTVAAFSIDKYLALHWHMRYATIVTTRRVVWIVVSFWVIFGAMSTVQIWSMTVYRVSVSIVVPLFLLVTSITYFRIYRVVLRHKVQIQSQDEATKHVQPSGDGTETASTGSSLNMTRYRKSVTSMFLVYCLFLLCYIPYICVQVIILITSIKASKSTEKDVRDYSLLYIAVDVTETIVIMNSLINPLIYCWRMREIRHAAKVALSILRCKSGEQLQLERSMGFSAS